MSIQSIDTALQTIARLINQVKDNVTSYYSDTSLVDVTKLMRVEPLCIISRDCMSLEYMPDISQSLLTQFCAYYLQAVNMLTRVDHIEIVKVLDRLNPDRDSTGFLLSEKLSAESMAIESAVTDNYRYGLPTRHLRAALETLSRDLHEHAYEARDINERIMQEAANLSVGKTLNVHINYATDTTQPTEGTGATPKNARATLKVSVRLLASLIPNETINTILTAKKEDMSVSERWHAYRSGRISFINDMIFCQDVIDEYKKAMLMDDTGTMQEIIRRVNNAKKFGILTKNPSLVASSNLFVISEEVARSIESELGGRLSDPTVREKAFDSTYAMIIAVVNRDWKRVTFYTRGIASGTDVSVNELKTASKDKGADIMETLKQFNMGMPASF